VEGQVLDASGRGVDGARIAVGVAPAYLPAGAMPEGVALSDANGNFTLRGVQPGKLRIAAYAPGIGRGSVDGVEVDGGRTRRGVVIRLDQPSDAEEPLGSGGVAVTLGERADGDVTQIVVMHVAASSEAERAGLSPGDVIERIDGERPSGMADARARLAGRAGSDVVLDVQRRGASTRLRATREPVRR
jgi:S1-C subfamily serine protease